MILNFFKYLDFLVLMEPLGVGSRMAQGLNLSKMDFTTTEVIPLPWDRVSILNSMKLTTKDLMERDNGVNAHDSHSLNTVTALDTFSK